MDPIEAMIRETRRQQRGFAKIAAESIELMGGVVSFAGPGSWANLAVGVGLGGPVSEAEVDALVEYHHSRGVPSRAEILPIAHPTLVAALADRGFVLRRFENMWLRALPPGEDLRAALPHGWPAGVEVAEVRPGEEELFVDVSMSGFVPEGQAPNPTDREVGLRMLASPGVVSLLARADGQVAGAASGAVDGEAGGLFGATVLPAFRRRGLQSALIVGRMEALRARGATVACIESEPGIATERNARRLGFALAGTKVLLERPLPAGR